MASPSDPVPMELHIFSVRFAAELVELLTTVAHFHRTGSRLDLGHTVDLGRPWLPGSACDHALISRPYVDGPRLERLRASEFDIRCFWLLPITQAEREFKKEEGLEALEAKFDAAGILFADSARPSVS